MRTLVRAHRRKGKIVHSHVRSVKRKPTRYTTRVGTFKRMTDPAGSSKKTSKFHGCERSMISKGYSSEAAKKICGSIARKKNIRRNYGAAPNMSKMTEEERNKEMKEYFDGGWRQFQG